MKPSSTEQAPEPRSVDNAGAEARKPVDFLPPELPLELGMKALAVAAQRGSLDPVDVEPLLAQHYGEHTQKR